MSLATETQRVQQGVKDTMKTLIQKLGGTVGSERVDGYAALASAISNKLLPDNLLSASTAALYGKPGTATPDEVFAMLYNAGNIEKVFESSTAGATTFDLPADTLLWWGLAVGGGGGGQAGGKDSSSNTGYGGGGGNGGQVLLCGPVLPGIVTNNSIVVGAGGIGGSSGYGRPGASGGSTSVFGLIMAEGGVGGGSHDEGTASARFLATYAVGGEANGASGQDGILVSLGPYLSRFAAAGGAGQKTYDGSGGAGGTAQVGAGGKGGDAGDDSTPGQIGANGSAGGGGGGGGAGNRYTLGGACQGGRGGDGYAAIFIIRKGGRT